MNFVKRNILARESVEGAGSVVPDGLELPAESVEGVLADIQADTKTIEANDSDADLLAEDGDETEAQLGALDNANDALNGEGGEDGEEEREYEEDMPDDQAEELDVAQESIRRRWCFDHRSSVAHESYGKSNRRVAARESLWEDIKAFLKRISEWLKEQGRKLKDQWIKFSNLGKSLQKRAKKLDALARKLGAKKKEEISGAFIKQLSTGKTFSGNDVSALTKALDLSGEHAARAEKSIDRLAGLVSDVEASEKKPADADLSGIVDAALRGSERNVELIGGRVLKFEVKVEEGVLTGSSSLVDTEGTVENNVKTPDVAKIGALITFINKMGIELEKRAKDYRKVEAARGKYESNIDKLLKKIDGVKLDDSKDLTNAVRAVRSAITVGNQVVGVQERAASFVQATLAKGVPGYVQAAIAAYGKQK